ncbi:putative 8-amino-7-oxononanoate synthase-like protein [Hapsidospora chrysogenum ATCC 11550]|uniref:Putative 8-amino-7-oxononanoate synthase-like protein n=1 Tax=Hapsidospora chrysogenum (strain ATCC 11550 / CBS 779.69 / DSM 880 / IAM 14645 / JCM 23072 / IMI 49137) TaxID=857340 RepID=A0A086T8I8_HAPC1|nr:putative 8-amino-7-oxononanoate synthase-like protein [Hapsidospora chrysogenum ATCC 11550]
MERKSSRLDGVYASILARRGTQGRLRRLTIPTPETVDFSSNSYLSLSRDQDIWSAYLDRLQQSPANQGFSLGSGGSRLLDGNSAAAEALECTAAAFHGAPAGLLFNSGFEANTGLFGCAPQPGDVVVYDELIHASVHDGIRLSRARGISFAHNCVRGKSRTSLDHVLSELTQGQDGHRLRAGEINVFVAVESVYSMDGDLAPLADIVECVEERLPNGNGYIVVDEAHATGWLGERGRGLVCHLGLEDRVWARVHTFGKAMGCAGAIVLCSPTTRQYLINYARSFIYTTAMGYPTLAGIQTAYEYLESGRVEPRLAHLRSLIKHTHRLLTSICTRHQPPPRDVVLYTKEGVPESPIIPLFTAHARSLAEYLQRRGFMVRPIVAPTVPAGTDRVRLCLHAGNTMEEVQGLCKAIDEWVAEKLSESGEPSEKPSKL